MTIRYDKAPRTLILSPLSPAERRILVEKPFPIVRRLTTSYPHSGTLIQHGNDMDGIRRKLDRGESINEYSDLGTLVATGTGGIYDEDQD